MNRIFKPAKAVAVFLCLIMVLSLGACAKKSSSVETTKAATAQTTVSATDKQADKNHKLNVYTSIYPMFYLTSRIAGDVCNVQNLIPGGVEAHDWEPNVDDIVKLNDADVLVFNGAGMEHWVEDINNSLDNEKLLLVEASKGLDLLEGHHHEHGEEGHEHHHEHGEEGHEHHHADSDKDHDHDKDCCAKKEDCCKEDKDHHAEDCCKANDEHKDKEHEHGEEGHKHHHEDHDKDHDHEHGEEGHEHCCHHGKWDPHVWLSPVKAKEQAQNIADALKEVDPANEATYTKNFEALAKDLDQLDADLREGLKDLKSNLIVTNHEAFAYLAHEYNLQQEGITGIYADQEPSPQRMAEIIDFVKDHKISTIFAEEILSPKVSQAIAEATGAKVEVLSPVESLTTEQEQNGEDYLAVMRKNLETLKKSLK